MDPSPDEPYTCLAWAKAAPFPQEETNQEGQNQEEGKFLYIEVGTQELFFLKLCVYLSYTPSCLYFFKFQRKLLKTQ